ncbi:MAG: acetyl-CoA carboxylase carboxyltransferase subunit alpha [Lentisphaeria bacterium]|nr:acetyl-CoA carboxylase carboxyltransferase subunit alpha [Lentisphaeria bacterium]MBO7153028.1 acetyl-CoA carboxylase carboxyltransferase subunit alpha [Lentisphaeria bacterium]
MNENTLDFEKQISELQGKINELEAFSKTSGIDCSEQIEALNQHLDKMKAEVYSNLSAWQRIQLSRHPGRPYALDYIERIFNSFCELSGDRRFKDDKAIVGGFAKLINQPVMVIGTQKGRDMKSNVYRNFGWPHPEGYRKANRLMRLADKAQVPVICLIDTPGAFPGIASEERHIAEAIAANLRDMFELTVPVIAVIIGEGGSGGAIGLGVGNSILVMENAYYSVITPEGCAAILWKDRKYAPQAADALKLTADKLIELGIADEIVPEPFGGAHNNFDEAAKLLAEVLKKHLDKLGKLSGEEIKEQRYAKFRAMGRVEELAANEA